MPRQFDGQDCVLCGVRPSSPTGEHVLPKWLVDEFPAQDGPFTNHRIKDGVAEVGTNRDGFPREYDSIGAVKLPCCQYCNGVLARRFEVPAKEIVRSVLRRSAIPRPANYAQTLGLWLVKTWLLLAHPSAIHSQHDFKPSSWDLTKIPDDIYSWMITGSAPPSGLSVWLTRQGDGPSTDATRHIDLPTIIADDRITQFQVKQVGLRWMFVELVYHPGWEIRHPLEVEGRAMRLWPAVGSVKNVVDLRTVATRDFAWVDGHAVEFSAGAYNSSVLPPLAFGKSMTDYLSLPGVVAEYGPPLTSRIGGDSSEATSAE